MGSGSPRENSDFSHLSGSTTTNNSNSSPTFAGSTSGRESTTILNQTATSNTPTTTTTATSFHSPEGTVISFTGGIQSRANDSDSMTSSKHTSGVTQTIRAKLNFLDEGKWKKFSARRLELIDGLHLSSKKASEQDDKISAVADDLRREYGFPTEALGDFDRLVRAGIQSVRRNRKRQPKVKSEMHSPPGDSLAKSTTSSLSPPSTENLGLVSDGHAVKRMRSNSIDEKSQIFAAKMMMGGDHAGSSSIGSSMDKWLPSMANLSINKESEFVTACIRMHALLTKNEQPLPPVNSSSNSNHEFLGDSTIRAAVAYAIEKRFPMPVVTDNIEAIRSVLLGPTVVHAMTLVMALSTESSLKLAIAGSCRTFGFDATISALSNIYYELLTLGSSQNADLANAMEVVALFPTSLINLYGHNKTQALPLIRPVTLSFQGKKLEFTYSPRRNTPPTMTELIENGKKAFHIVSGAMMVQLVCNSHNGRVLESDSDVEEVFNDSPRVDIEMFVPFTDSSNTYSKYPQHQTQRQQQVNQLPPLSAIAQQPRYQQLL